MTLEVPNPWAYDDRNKRWTRQFDNGNHATILRNDEGERRTFTWVFNDPEWGTMQSTEPSFAAAQTSAEEFSANFPIENLEEQP